MPRSASVRKIRAVCFERPLPRRKLRLLRADMKRDAIGVKAQPVGEVEHLDGHFRYAAELPRKGHSAPSPSVRMRQKTLGARRGTGDFLDLLCAVDGKEGHAEAHARVRCRAPS